MKWHAKKIYMPRFLFNLNSGKKLRFTHIAALGFLINRGIFKDVQKQAVIRITFAFSLVKVLRNVD